MLSFLGKFEVCRTGTGLSWCFLRKGFNENSACYSIKREPNLGKTELEGTTLRVYAFVASAGKPVGTHEIMRGAHVGSSGSTYKHLQRLENLGLLAKNDYGDYVLKRKIAVKGYHWIGKRLLPRMMLYGFLFLGILVLEIAVLAIHYNVENYEFKVFFLILGTVTTVATISFIIEGFRVLQRLNQKKE